MNIKVAILLLSVFSIITAGQFQNDQYTYALYHFNEGSGTALFDSSGHGYNGTLTGCTWVTGKFGSGLGLNGMSDYVTVSQSVPVRNVSFELWLRPDTGFKYQRGAPGAGFETRHSILGLYGWYSSGLSIDSAQDSLTFYTSSTYESTAKMGRQNNWLYVAVTIDTTDTVRLYINGQLANKSLESASTRSWSTLYLGANYYTGMCAFFRGTIDELRISNTVRSASEISSYWAANSGNPGTLNTTIYNASTNAPIAGATVQMTSGGSQYQTTNSNGAASFASLSAGNYTFSVLAPGYISDTGMPVNIIGGQTTNVSWFLTPLTAPTAPTLVSPSNGAAGLSTAPTFTWNQVSLATSYRLEVSNSSAFSILIYDQAGITGTSASVGGFSNGNNIYWRVNATNTAGTSIWSPVWSLTIGKSAVLPEKDILLPNQFSITPTGICYILPSASKVLISLYDLQGRLVSRLANQMEAAGQHSLNFGRSGITKAGCYVLDFKAEGIQVNRKVTIVQ